MFKFERETENHNETNEFDDKSNPFEKIDPYEGMSVDEAIDFWHDEFNIKYQEFQENYSEYLSEVFNWSDEKFDFDINMSDELKSSISKFDESKWNEISDEEKVSILNEVKDLVAKELGLLDIPELNTFVDDWGPYGFYDPYSDTVNINIEKSFLDDPKELLNTLIHELRHAFQWERSEVLDTKEDAMYRCNLENYITADKSFYAYENQYVEAEARAYADTFIKTYEEAEA